MHVHTRAGSADSSITVDALGEHAQAAGVEGIVVAEHFRVWSDWEREAFTDRWGIRVYRAMEATTDIGHILLLGAPPGYAPASDSRTLLRRARSEGIFTILAHPFRFHFDSIHAGARPVFRQGAPAEELAESEIFSLVDAVEIENGGCNDRENAMAVGVARVLGLPVTTGSDAHHVHEIGKITIPVPEIPRDDAALVELISGLTLSDVLPGDRSPSSAHE